MSSQSLSMSRADALLPVLVDFAAIPAGLPARACRNLQDGWSAEGQTIHLDLREGEMAAGARAWAALAQPGRGLEFSTLNMPPPDVLLLTAGAVLRAWSHRPGPRAPLHVVTPYADAVRADWPRVAAALAGNIFARDLVVQPANALTPAAFVRQLRKLRRHGVVMGVRGPDQLRQGGYGALSAVGRAARTGPYLVTLSLPGEGAPLALVGKGMCFDTGGISIKPAQDMEAMRADMAGAAACAGAMLAAALRNAGPVVAVLAIAENGIGADSYRPGDVLISASGRSIEVADTDAEGRLALADALHHAAGLKPRAMVDVATLTGSIVTALGHHRAGLFGNDEPLRDALLRASRSVHERLWPMPIGAQHRRDLDSDIADIKQCGSGRLQPDACHAAAFLREFAGDLPWAHLDIAGVDLAGEDDPFAAKGMPTGFGARLLDALIG